MIETIEKKIEKITSDLRKKSKKIYIIREKIRYILENSDLYSGHGITIYNRYMFWLKVSFGTSRINVEIWEVIEYSYSKYLWKTSEFYYRKRARFRPKTTVTSRYKCISSHNFSEVVLWIFFGNIERYILGNFKDFSYKD